MQSNHGARVTIHISLLVFSIIYYRSIDSCVHSTILWRVKDTKHLLEHKDSMRGNPGSPWQAGTRRTKRLMHNYPTNFSMISFLLGALTRSLLSLWVLVFTELMNTDHLTL